VESLRSTLERVVSKSVDRHSETNDFLCGPVLGEGRGEGRGEEVRGLRVVGGELRSRRLVGPPDGVRPTSDRVREALFSKLGDVAGARVLDLFAGTGALSAEALSRGAETAVLVDVSARSLAVCRRNVDALGLGKRATVLAGDALRVMRRLGDRGPFDLVFLDPPYGSERLAEVLPGLVDLALLAPDATVVVETAKRHSLAPPPGLEVTAERDYGDTRITWMSQPPT
jgi:16S rRNA (guanine(966)-N(2))-methyltransferase RsmD